MTDSILELARELEELLPDALRTLFAPVESDPFSDLPVGQLRVLRILARGATTPRELASTLSITPAAVAQVVARLQQHGLVETECLEHDRRCKQVRLTEVGHTQMRTRREARADQAVRILQEMPPDQREALVAALRSLTRLKLQPAFSAGSVPQTKSS